MTNPGMCTTLHTTLVISTKIPTYNALKFRKKCNFPMLCYGFRAKGIINYAKSLEKQIAQIFPFLEYCVSSIIIQIQRLMTTKNPKRPMILMIMNIMIYYHNTTKVITEVLTNI